MWHLLLPSQADELSSYSSGHSGVRLLKVNKTNIFLSKFQLHSQPQIQQGYSKVWVACFSNCLILEMTVMPKAAVTAM
jgi:hypothetical protein